MVMWGLSKVQSDRRIAPREAGPFAAVVRLYSGRLFPCTVLNVSETGAKLGLVKDINLPKQFELSIPAKNALWRVRVVWQQGKELGVCRV
jgi:hypothetical protein